MRSLHLLSTRQRFQLALSLLATIALGGYFFSTVNWLNVSTTLVNVNLYWLSTAAGCLLLHQIVRALRIRAIVAQDDSIVGITATCVLQSWLGMLLPSGLAQATFIYMLKELHAVRIARALSGLLVMRLIDLMLFALVALAIAAVVNTSHETDINRIVAIVALLIIMTGIGLIVLSELSEKMSVHNNILMERLTGLVRLASEDLLQSIKIQVRLKIILTTSLIWLALFGSYASLCLSLGVQPGIFSAILGFSILMLINLLPIHGIAGVGTHHLAWYLVLTLIGMEEESAKVIASTTHVLMLVLFTVWVPLAVIYLMINKWSGRTSRVGKI